MKCIKRIIIMISLLFCLSGVYAQILKTEYSFDLEYIPTGAVASYEVASTYFDLDGNEYRFVLPDVTQYTKDFRMAFNIRVTLWDHLFIGGRMGTVFSLKIDPIYGIAGNPNFLDSLFFAGLKYGNIEIGMQRFCNHPVVANAYARYITSLNAETSWGKFYLKISGKF